MQALHGSEAIPILLSTKIVERLKVETKDSSDNIKVANKNVTGTIGTVSGRKIFPRLFKYSLILW